MKWPIAAALLSASVVIGASPVVAQTKYYMREKVVGASGAATPPSKKVATSCGDFARSAKQSGSGAPSASLGNVTTYTAGQAFCLAEAKKAGTVGTCVWDLGPRSPTAYTVWFYPDAVVQSSTNGDLYAGVCS